MSAKDLTQSTTGLTLVTGCCGYLGSWITFELLRAGRAVRGTSIDPGHARRLFEEAFDEHGLDDEARSRLEIVGADLHDGGSWRGVAEGCETVVHTACPVEVEGGGSAEGLVAAAVEGTGHVVREAARAGSVRRFVHMSSIVTLLDHHRPSASPGRAEVVGPSSWNETSSPDSDPYAYAKVRGERAARALVRELLPGATFAAVLPGPVIGPPLAGKRVPGSVDKTMRPLLEGQLRFGSVDLPIGLVDVRDVASVFVRVTEFEAGRLGELGEGARFICVAKPLVGFQQVADIIARDHPRHARVLPKRELPLPRWLLLAVLRLTVTREAYRYTRAMLGRRVEQDTTLTEQVLGQRWRPVAQTLGDTVRWIDRRGGLGEARE